MTLSLRARLLIGVMSLVVLGILLFDIAMYLLFSNSLLGRVDTQLTRHSTVDTAFSVLSHNGRGEPGSAGGFPVNSVTELIGRDGSVALACRVGGFGSTPGDSAPVLPKHIETGQEGQPTSPVTVAGTGGIEHYRMTAWSEDSFSSQTVVFAIPIDDISATLAQLLQLELFISLAVVAATAVLAWFLLEI